jgi:FOG: WD40 repeat
MTEPDIFTVGGTVQAGRGIYLARQADEELFQHCLTGDFSYVLTARQMGKSSLMVRTSERLREAGIYTAIVDLTRLGTMLHSEQWYLGLAHEFVDQLELDLDYKAWWASRTHLGVTQRLNHLLREIVMEKIDAPLVIFVDEIDTTLSLDFADDLFAVIRSCYNSRSTDPAYHRLAFVLLGVASPSELIRDPQRTPFNIGTRIELTDFTLEQAIPLAGGFGLEPAQARRTLQWVLDWTGGHPYLTQRLCHALVERTLLEQTQAEQVLPEPNHLAWDEGAVAQVVEKTFFGTESQPDANLQFVRGMLLEGAPNPVDVLGMYQRVLRQEKVEDDERSLGKVYLKLSGVVSRRASKLLRVSNRIYARVFNLEWVQERLELIKARDPLRSRALEWEVRHKDRSRLLRGTELVEAELLLRSEPEDMSGKGIVQEFVAKSRKTQERQRQLNQLIFILVLAVMASLTIFAWRQAGIANNASLTAVAGLAARDLAATSEVRAQQTSNAQSTSVANAQATSRALQGTATVSAELAQQVVLTLSKGLAGDARSRMEINYIQGLLLSIESFRLLENYNLSQDHSPDTIPFVLNQMPPGLTRNLQLSSGVVRKILYAPNGNLMVSMSDAIDLWNTEDPASPNLITGWQSVGSSKPSDVIFSPNSKLMIIGYQDGRVELWDVSTTHVTNFKTLNDFSSPTMVAISPDNSVLAVAGNNTIKFWDISDPRSPQEKGRVAHPHEISDRSVEVTYLSFVPGYSTPYLVSGGQDNYLRIWNLGKYAYNPSSPEGNAFPFETDLPHVALSSKYLIIADKKVLRIFFLSNSGREFAGAYSYDKIHQGEIESLAISPDQHRLYTSAQDGSVAEWDMTDPRHMKYLRRFNGPMRNIVDMAFHPAGNVLAMGNNEARIAIWNLAKHDLAPIWQNEISDTSEITDIAYSPKLNLLAVGDAAGFVALWDVSDPLALTEKPKKSISTTIRHIVFNPSETALSFVGDWSENGEGPTVYIRDLQRLEYSDVTRLFQTNTPDVFAVSDHYLLGGEVTNGITSIFQMDLSKINVNREIKRVGATAECPFRDTAFARNGSLAAIAACNVQLWDFSDGKAPSLLNKLDAVDPRGVAFNAEGTLLASANANSSISIWSLDPNTGIQPLATITTAHASEVTGVAISPDGKTLASGGADQAVILWDISDPEHPIQRGVLGHHSSAVLNGAIFFLADGKTLISASKDEIILWDVDPQSWIEKACNLAGRNFSQSEWVQLVGRSVPYDPTCPDLLIPEN